jgi:YesN/AraC family two-component response regulator
MEYLAGKRIQAAKELLLTADLNISEVAYQTGFNDPLYFSRLFKKMTGLPPRQFAKRV